MPIIYLMRKIFFFTFFSVYILCIFTAAAQEISIEETATEEVAIEDAPEEEAEYFEPEIVAQGRSDDKPQQFFAVGPNGELKLITDSEEIKTWGNTQTSYIERETMRIKERAKLVPFDDSRPAGVPPKKKAEEDAVTSAKIIMSALEKLKIDTAVFAARIFVAGASTEFETKTVNVKKIGKMMLVESVDAENTENRYLRKDDSIYIFNPLNKALSRFSLNAQERSFAGPLSFTDFFAFGELISRYVIMPIFQETIFESLTEGQRKVYQITLLARDELREKYPEFVMLIDKEDFRIWHYELLEITDSQNFVREKRKEYTLLEAIEIGGTIPLRTASASKPLSESRIQNQDSKYYPLQYEIADYSDKQKKSTFIDVYHFSVNEEAKLSEADFSEKEFTRVVR